MKTKSNRNLNRPTPIVTPPQRSRLGTSIGLFLLTVTLAQAVNPFGSTVVTPTQTSQLSPGDIIRTDPGDAILGGVILKVDPQTGQETVLSHGGYLGSYGSPMGVVSDRSGKLIVANQGCLLRIDPQNGQQSMIRDANGAPGAFWSVALDRNDDILVAAETAILRVNPVTGNTTVVSSDGMLINSLSLALSGRRDGDIFVTSVQYEEGIGWVGAIIRVNPRNGKQTVVSEAGYLAFLLGITVRGDDIYVTGLMDHYDNFGVGQVVHVDARTGNQTVVSQGGNLVRPVGVTLDEDGQLIVADPYTINPESSDLFDGAIISINPETGGQTLIARGHGSLVNPCGVAIAPASTVSNGSLVRKQMIRSNAEVW